MNGGAVCARAPANDQSCATLLIERGIEWSRQNGIPGGITGILWPKGPAACAIPPPWTCYLRMTAPRMDCLVCDEDRGVGNAWSRFSSHVRRYSCMWEKEKSTAQFRRCSRIVSTRNIDSQKLKLFISTSHSCDSPFQRLIIVMYRLICWWVIFLVSAWI